MRVARSITGVAAAAALFAGCGDEEETARPSTEARTTALGPAVATVEVSATDFRFTPANPGVQRAGVIAFELTNDGQAPHALEVEGPEGEAETRTLKPGQRQTIKADLSRAGRYTLYCPVGDHRERGMEGFVLVAGGGSGTGTDGSGTTGPTETEAETESEGGDDKGGSGDEGSGGAKPEDDPQRDDSGGTPAPY